MNRLEKKIACILFLIILLMMPSVSISSEPVAEKPTYYEGDYWVLINRNKFKERKHTFQREEEDRIVCSLNGSDRTTYFHFKAKIKGSPVGYPKPIIDFPLTVGKKWNYKFQRKKSTGGTKRDKIRAQYKVEAYESVTVPAGTFHAFKITSISEATKRRMVTMPKKDQYWYCPEVKHIIKRINRRGDIWELKDYKIN